MNSILSRLQNFTVCGDCSFYKVPYGHYMDLSVSGICVRKSKELSQLTGACDQFVAGTYYSPTPLKSESAKDMDLNTCPVCLSCGMPLSVRTSGRNRYCSHCGCYLPKILYDYIGPKETVKLTKNGWVIVAV